MKKVIGKPLVLANGVVLPLSRGVESSTNLFVSGQLGLNDNGQIVDGGIAAQTRQVIKNIQKILCECGLTLDDVVKITGWLVSEEDFAKFNKVYSEFFSIEPPARSIVVSNLLVPEALIELEAIATIS